MEILEFAKMQKNEWTPPELSEEEKASYCQKLMQDHSIQTDRLVVFKMEPYIDCLFIRPGANGEKASCYTKRFTFHEDYIWDFEEENLFLALLLHNDSLDFTCDMDKIYTYYSEKYPDWKLKRYYTKPMRLLDHIYHCMRKGTAKEMLYKAGLDELAVHIADVDEIDLLSRRPSDIYGGLSMKVLRSLNCGDGSLLLASANKRKFLKELQLQFPEIFKVAFNDAQCRYLNYLIDGDLTVNEAGRLFSARRKDLFTMWTPSQFEIFMWKEFLSKEVIATARAIAEMDPIYQEYIGKINPNEIVEIQDKIKALRYYLLQRKEEYDAKFRRSNRRRPQGWQERGKGYVVRYPQTIHDFCRESIYMSNCLLTYVEAYIENDTTILFMRREGDVNTPFITLEVFHNELMQAYHRFNVICTQEEDEWIRKYCDRKGIVYNL